jgi:hypothetical protein
MGAPYRVLPLNAVFPRASGATARGIPGTTDLVVSGQSPISAAGGGGLTLPLLTADFTCCFGFIPIKNTPQ